MTHPADLYQESQERVVVLARAADPALAVPACPGWTVHDVVAHLVGLAVDVTHGRVDGYAGKDWTALQVAQRADHSMTDMIDEWNRTLPSFVDINRDLAASDLPEMINHVLGPVPKASFESAFLVDLVHHEHDLLGAMGTSRITALPADVASMRSQLANVRRRFGSDHMPTLRFSPPDADRFWDIGSEGPSAWLAAPVIEALRAFGGRRTYDEIRAFAWSGEFDGMAERLVLPFFEAPRVPVRGE